MRQLALIILSVCSINWAFATATKTPPPSVWDGTNASLGFSTSSGNSNVTNLTAGLLLQYTKGVWQNTFTGNINYAESAGDVTKEKYTAGNQTQYTFSPKTNSYIFFNNTLSVDEFSAYDYQFVASAGFGHDIVRKKYLSWSLQAGPGVRFNQPTSNHHIEERVILSTGSTIDWHITQLGELKQATTANWGRDYSYIDNTVSFTNPITDHIALSVVWEVDHYTDLPPDSSDTHKTDMTTSVNLVYNF